MLEQAFVLPLPKSAHVPECEEKDPRKIQFWRAALDQLAEKRLGWEQFLKENPVSPQHPALKLTTSNEGNSLLHLAVLFNKKEVVETLSTDRSLKLKRNNYGFTPLELAQFLYRQEIEKILRGAHSSLPTFRTQPNVIIPDNSLSFDMEFLANPAFENLSVFQDILSRAQKAKWKDSIPPEKIWMGIYFDKEIQTGLHPSVSIRYVDKEVGYGVFAEQSIPSCAFVGEYTGMVKERNKKEMRDQFHSVRYTVWEMDKKKFILDGKTMGNFTRFINHSNDPNLCLQSVYWRGIPRMIFVAIKEIPKEAQLTFDYGTFFWKECQQTPKPL